jgi:hypothetical protein
VDRAEAFTGQLAGALWRQSEAAKLIEEPFGWIKPPGDLRKTRHHGCARLGRYSA